MKNLWQELEDREWETLSERDQVMLSFLFKRINWWGRRLEIFLGIVLGLLSIIAYTLLFGPPGWTSWFS